MMETDSKKANLYNYPGVDSTSKNNSEVVKDRYKMNHADRGYAVILNNRSFDESLNLAERTGTDIDLRRVLKLLRDHLGFQRNNVKFWHNATKTHMEDVIKTASLRDYSNSDCFVAVILTYGTKNGYIYGKDGKIKIDELIEPLHSANLAGKPKFLFIQACKKETGDTQSRFDHDGNLDEESDEEVDGDNSALQVRIPAEADFLVAISCTQGSLHDTEGSIFIKSLFEVLSDGESKEEELHASLTKVLNKASKSIKSKKLDGIPCIFSRLTRKVFFNSRDPEPGDGNSL